VVVVAAVEGVAGDVVEEAIITTAPPEQTLILDAMIAGLRMPM